MTQLQTQRVVRLDGASQIVEVPDPAPAVVGAPTASDYGGVKLGAAIAAPAAMTATADTNSAATDVAGLLADHNDLVSKYNALLTDTTALRTTLASVLAQLKAKTIPV
ncbi:phenylalanyl-tRNA synthetase subunit beta [Escherichia coli]